MLEKLLKQFHLFHKCQMLNIAYKIIFLQSYFKNIIESIGLDTLTVTCHFV